MRNIIENGIELEVAFLLGEARVPIARLLAMGRGGMIALESTSETPVQITANRHAIGHGVVEVAGDRIGLRILSIGGEPEQGKEG